jgi:hypothetical protein
MTLSETDIITDKGTGKASFEYVAKHHEKMKSTPQENNAFPHRINAEIANAKTSFLDAF